MAAESGSPAGRTDISERPCPGLRVAAACDLPSETHSRVKARAGTPGEIVRTPAYFCTTYSIKFDVHGKQITLHGINRHEFRIIGEESGPLAPGFPPLDRYPQPHRVAELASEPSPERSPGDQPPP